MVDLQAITYRFGCIVLTDHNGFTAVIADAFSFGRIDCNVIGSAALSADAAAGHAAFDHSIINLNGNYMVDTNASCIQSLCLGQGAGHPVQDKAILAIRLCGPLGHQVHHQIIGDQLAFFHALFHLLAQITAIRHGLSEHVARGNGRDIQVLHQQFSLSTLAGAGRA